MTETWLPVPSHPPLSVSTEGRVRSAPYDFTMPNGGSYVRALSPTRGVVTRAKPTASYQRLNLMFRGRNYRVARLVCEAFHGPPPTAKSVVIHRDENSLNNKPENLRWGTQKENMNAPGYKAYRRSLSAKRKGPQDGS